MGLLCEMQMLLEFKVSGLFETFSVLIIRAKNQICRNSDDS